MSNKKNIFFYLSMLLLLLLGAGYLLVTNIRIKNQREKLIAQIENIEKEIQILQQKNEEVQEKISQAGSKEYLEKIAREQFDLKAPGEEVVVISKEAKPAESSDDKRSPWNPKTWWSWFKGLF